MSVVHVCVHITYTRSMYLYLLLIGPSIIPDLHIPASGPLPQPSGGLISHSFMPLPLETDEAPYNPLFDSNSHLSSHDASPIDESSVSSDIDTDDAVCSVSSVDTDNWSHSLHSQLTNPLSDEELFSPLFVGADITKCGALCALMQFI